MKKKAKVNIKVNPLNTQSHQTKIKSNIRKDIIDFINSLTYDGFILAGNSVANMIENIDIKGDLDFWVLDKDKYLNVLEEFYNREPLMYDIYPSMIEIIFKDLPVVNLILSDMTAEATATSFDFDYCRCYYTPETGCVASEICLDSIFTKTIRDEIAYGDIRPSRIAKAIKYGYSFNRKFWNHFPELLKDRTKLNCNICLVAGEKSRNGYYCRHYDQNLPIGTNDLNLTNFMQSTFDIKISDPTNIEGSVSELEKIFNGFYMMQKNNLKLPKLFSFTAEKIDLVKIYVDRIILFNPVRNGNYLEVKFSNDRRIRAGSRWIFRNGKYDDDELMRIFEDKEDTDDSDEQTQVKTKKSKKNEDEDEEDTDDSDEPTQVKTKKSEEFSDEEEMMREEEDDSDEPTPVKRKKSEKNEGEKDDSEEPTPVKNKSSAKKSNEDNEDEDKEKYGICRKTLGYDPIFSTNDIIYLNATKTAYLKIMQLPKKLKLHATENFNEMFNLHPEEKHKIIMYLDEVQVNRWQQSYLKTPPLTNLIRSQSYMYSGFDTTDNNNQLPEQFQVYYDHMKSLDDKYNQVVINWYQDNNDYIAYHADCENGMIPNAKIAIVSLYEKDVDDSTDYRIFSIVPKNDKIDCPYEKINIVARHGTIIMMCGNTQKEFKHSIEKSDKNLIPRISISFRQFE